jgi:hypothetical protein
VGEKITMPPDKRAKPARLERKPEVEIVHSPKDFAAWERERLYNRGLGE